MCKWKVSNAPHICEMYSFSRNLLVTIVLSISIYSPLQNPNVSKHFSLLVRIVDAFLKRHPIHETMSFSHYIESALLVPMLFML